MTPAQDPRSALVKKLGLKPGMRVRLLHPPEDYWDLLEGEPDALGAWNGMVRASWPKKSSGVTSDIGRSEVMRAGKEGGLVDVRVCAVDATWSGLKFVIRLDERPPSAKSEE